MIILRYASWGKLHQKIVHLGCQTPLALRQAGTEIRLPHQRSTPSFAGLPCYFSPFGEEILQSPRLLMYQGQAPTVPRKKNLLPSATHLEEGRGTTISELLRLENCISRLCPRPLGSPPPPPPTPK